MSFPNMTSLAPEAIYKEYAAANRPARIGTLGIDEYGSLYRVCKLGGNLVAGVGCVSVVEYPVANANVIADNYDGDMATVDIYGDTAAIGDLVIRTDDASASTRVVNFYEGGSATFYGGAVAQRQQRRIVSSTVGDGTSIYITLDAPITVAITDGAIDMMPSQYSNCVSPAQETSAYESFVAYPRIASGTSGYYFWGLTRGPLMGHYRATWPGAVASDRDVYFGPDGEIDSTTNLQYAIETYAPQRAGYTIMCNTAGYGCVYFMLQLE